MTGRRRDETDIGRDPEPGFEQNHVTGNDALASYLFGIAIPKDCRVGFEEFLECAAAFFGLPLLDATNQGVDRQHKRDECSICLFTDGEGTIPAASRM